MSAGDGNPGGRVASKNKDKSAASVKRQPQAPKPKRSYNLVPISFYWFKDLVKDFVGQKNFPDALAVIFAMLSASIAFPFFPVLFLIPLAVVLFIVTLFLPLLGLMLLLFTTLLMVIYQAPLLAWILTLFISVALFLGYKHYRTITYIYAMIMLPFSYVGAVLEIPAFLIGTLFIGFRRAIISALVVVLLVSMISGLTGLQNTGPIAYSAANAHSSISTSPAIMYLTPSKSAAALGNFSQALASSLASFISFPVASHLFQGFTLAFQSLVYELPITAIEVFVWLVVVFAMTNYVIASRSMFKGSEASLFGFVLVLNSFFASLVLNTPFLYGTIAGFLLAPVIVFVLEYNNIGVAKALEVMKQDFLGKFGEVFQDLTSGTNETLDDVANYEETKAELKQAILAPIEHREITGAYNVKPAKGILLFGPPGNGKTLIMRALSNEIRARFFYVKTSSIVSPFQGESIQALSKIFATVKKHAPAVLFFDEIDGIAGNRELQESDSSRQLLSTLLSEMDGFQKMEGIVIVGATNIPNVLDPAVMRPGRFDKVIYMPLPDTQGREKIFEHYLKRLPIGDDISYSKLAEITPRYSGADIKNVCEETARAVADVAVKERKVLNISMADFVRVIKLTKPSTPLSRIEEYNTFKVDYERRTHPEPRDVSEEEVKLEDVVGLEEAKKALYEAIEIPILHPNLIKKYDVGQMHGVLLFGPPGTGKSMLMKAISSELPDVNLQVISGADMSRQGVEKAVLTVKEIFNRAKENTPSIIFIDEIDSLLSPRGQSSELSVQVTAEFLQEFDGVKSNNGVVVVGATNRPSSLDSALFRGGRFDRIIFTSPPNAEDRAKLFAMYLKKAPCGKDIDYAKLADMTRGYTGADIANICRQAKLEALERNVATSAEATITMNDLMVITRKIRPSATEAVVGEYLSFLSIYGGK